MTTIRMLQPVAEWAAGAVIAVEDRRAQRLVRTGYAEVVQTASAAKPMKSRKERAH